MKQRTKHTDQESRTRVPTRRASALAGVLIGISLLASGCGGSSPKDAGRGGPSPAQADSQAVAFSVCMRTHGVPAFPDPQISGSGGGVQAKVTITAHPGSAGAVNQKSPAFKTARKACGRLLLTLVHLAGSSGEPSGTTGGSQTGGTANGTQHSRALQFADCMRAHGIPEFPDPSSNGAFNLPSDINQQGPQFKRAEQACANVQPSDLSIS
jgi:hypothetical protein